MNVDLNDVESIIEQVYKFRVNKALSEAEKKIFAAYGELRENICAAESAMEIIVVRGLSRYSRRYDKLCELLDSADTPPDIVEAFEPIRNELKRRLQVLRHRHHEKV